MKRFVLSLALLLLAAAVHAEEARGDRPWERRAEGFAATQKVDRAIADGAVSAYEQALAAHPESLRLRFKETEMIDEARKALAREEQGR